MLRFVSATILADPALPAWSAPCYSEAQAGTTMRTGSVASALSRALDLSTGQPTGHSIRSCILGMRIAREIGFSDKIRNDLYYALLLKDCGYSSNASIWLR